MNLVCRLLLEKSQATGVEGMVGVWVGVVRWVGSRGGGGSGGGCVFVRRGAGLCRWRSVLWSCGWARSVCGRVMG